MCLWINPDPKKNKLVIQSFIRDWNEIYVYKVLQKWPHENFYRSWVYRGFIWDFRKQKEFKVDRDSKPTGSELLYGSIETGLHVYTRLTGTKYFCTIGLGCKAAIVKFRVRKEDIVAVGVDSNTAVCKRLEFVEIVED
jgi:hypothetical protein